MLLIRSRPWLTEKEKREEDKRTPLENEKKKKFIRDKRDAIERIAEIDKRLESDLPFVLMAQLINEKVELETKYKIGRCTTSPTRSTK